MSLDQTPTPASSSLLSGARRVVVKMGTQLLARPDGFLDPDYIRTIRGPIRDVPMLAGGPVPLDMIDAYLDAGCIAVNLGPSLAVPDLVRSGQWEEIGRRAVLATSIIQHRRNVEPPDAPYIH